MKRILLILWTVCLGATAGTTFGADSGVAMLDHSAEVKSAVQSLNSPDAGARLVAKGQLLRPQSGPWLKANSAAIISALQSDCESEESARILGRLDLPSDLAGRLRDSEQVPDAVRARLGNSAAEQRVISGFENAKTFTALHANAGELAYVESPTTLQAFVRGLQSQQVVTDVHGNQVSVPLLLIQAYGNMHPDEPLFSPGEYLKHANVSAEAFKQPEHQEYLRQLEARLLARNQIHVTINPPFLLNTDKVEEYR